MREKQFQVVEQPNDSTGYKQLMSIRLVASNSSSKQLLVIVCNTIIVVR